MRVLQVHNHYQQKGGEDVVVANERTLLEQSGHAVKTFTISNSAISGLSAKWSTFRNTTYNHEVRSALAARLREERPDIVHVHNTFPLLSPSVYDACADVGLPVVQTLHNFRFFCAAATLLRNGTVCELCLDHRPHRAVLYRCYRNSVLGSLAAANLIAYHYRHRTWSTKVARFVALSTFTRSKFIEAGFPPERIVVKPNFVVDPGTPASRHRQGVLFAGRLSPEKGAMHLVQALSGTGIPLRILGDGPQRAELTAQAGNNVIFEGQVSSQRVREAMLQAKLVVFPSIWFEAFPLVVIEAFANGVPVVASKLGSLTEIVDDSITGRLVQPADPSALRTAILELLNDPQRLATMGLAARQRYETLYSDRRNIERLLSIYRDAIEGFQAFQA